jgi:sulfate adenylyltransferase subunit 1
MQQAKDSDYLDFFITDGLMCTKREQGITYDKYIYFLPRKVTSLQIPRSRRIYCNMVTGVSTSQARSLIDARKGVIEQTYRHFSSIIY